MMQVAVAASNTEHHNLVRMDMSLDKAISW